MTDLLIASGEADARAVEAVESHHAEMAGTLKMHVDAVVNAAKAHAPAGAAVDRLAAWCTSELVPHALGEERTLYPAAAALPEGRLLVEAMVAEHAVITRLVEQISATLDPVAAATDAQALWEIFASHLAKENDLILPLLAASPEVSVAELLDGMHEILGGEPEGGCGSGHTCGCGGGDEERLVLDVRTVPHAIRHATVFGALDAVGPGTGLELVAPHDPLPLLAQIADRHHGAFAVEYLESGPEAWRLLLTRD